MYIEYLYRIKDSKRWEVVEGYTLPLVKTEQEVFEILSKLPYEVRVLEMRLLS